jgi:hypothetical protein
MAEYELELRFCGQFVSYAGDSAKEAWQVLTIVKPEMLESPLLSDRYALLADRFAAGHDLDDPADSYDETWQAISGASLGRMDIISYALRIREQWSARQQAALLRLGYIEAEKAINDTTGKPRRIAERLGAKLLDMFTVDGDSGKPVGIEEMAQAEIDAMSAINDPGVTVPFGKLHAECGPWLPGDVVGLTAYSGGGKSTLAANLARGWLRLGTPVIAFPTEMRERWLGRLGATMSGVPQWIIEKRQWTQATQDQKDSYGYVMEAMKRQAIEIVNRPNISPAEILAAVRVIRKRWTDRPVVVIVDHMHRLDYGGDDPNDAAGPATKSFKNFAGDNGIIFLLLYQPRKPPQGDVNRPTAGYEIRGNSMVWNELDVHFSPYRPWVKIDPHGSLTLARTPRALLDSMGRPVLSKPDAEDSKVSDEHVYLKIDKRRVGGEGPTVCLDFDAPTGSVMETAA